LSAISCQLLSPSAPRLPVILSPSQTPVILSEAKDLGLSRKKEKQILRRFAPQDDNMGTRFPADG
jgi:hypothetical protein